MADFTWTDKTFPWRIVNFPGVQAELKGHAIKGYGAARAIASKHVDTGQLLAGISVGTEVILKGGLVPVLDWLVHFDREDIEHIEFGGLRAIDTMYNQTGSRARWVPGLRIAHRTFKAMGG